MPGILGIHAGEDVNKLAEDPRWLLNQDLKMIDPGPEGLETFFEADALVVLRRLGRGSLDDGSALAILQKMEAHAETREMSLASVRTAYRTGLLGAVLLRFWDIADPEVYSKEERQAQISALHATKRSDGIRATAALAGPWDAGEQKSMGQTLSWLIERTPWINRTSRDGVTLVALAALQDWDAATIQSLVARGADPYIKDADGFCAMHHLREAGRDDLARDLLAKAETMSPWYAEDWKELLDPSAPSLR